MSNLQKLLDLNEEIINEVDEYDNSTYPYSNSPYITHFFSNLYTSALSFFPYDRYLSKLAILEQEAKNEFEKHVFDERSSYHFTSIKENIMREIKVIKGLIQRGMEKREQVSKYFIAYLDELEKYFKEETYDPEHIPSLAFFSDKAIPERQRMNMTEIEKEAAINATLAFKRSKSRSRSRSRKSSSKGGSRKKTK